jgi:hypothetical protein
MHDDETGLHIQVQADFYDETTVYINIMIDETDEIKPSELKFVLPDGTPLKVVKSDSVTQADDTPVYEVEGVQKA